MSNTPALKQSALSLPPKVKGYPLVGALPGLLSKRLDFLEAAQKQYGDIFTLDLGFSEIVVMCHPRHAQRVLIDHMKNYVKEGPIWDSFRTFLGDGLPVREGEPWRKQRRMMQPAFHHQKLVMLTEKMAESIDKCFEEDWEKAANSGEPFDIAKAVTRVTMNVLVRSLFGSGMEQGEADRVSVALAYVFDFMMLGIMTHSLPEWIPVPGKARYKESIQIIDETVMRVIERGRKDPTVGDNLLSLLLQMSDPETGEKMSDELLRDEAVSLFCAGYETTAVSMSWAFHFMAQNPELAQRLETEADAVLGQRAPGFNDLQQLTYSRNVVLEALRLYPPSYWMPRQTVAEDEVDGYRIPPNTMVAIILHLLHRNEDAWTDPNTFDPDRFTPERSVGRHKQAWVPFGAGQRQCIGKEFSLMEGPLILSRFAQRYRIKPVPGRVVERHVSTTQHAKDGVWVYLSKR